VRYELITWRGFHALCRQLAYQIREAAFQPDVIVGIARGGYMPARLLSDYLGIMNLTSFRIEHYRGARKQPVTRVKYPLSADLSGQRVLLVDDVSDTGDTFEVALGHLRERGEPTAVRTVVMHHKITSSYVPDFYAKKVVKWRWIVYPWAIMEDLAGIIATLEPRPEDIPEIMAWLERDCGLRLPRQTVLDALTFMEPPGVRRAP